MSEIPKNAIQTPFFYYYFLYSCHPNLLSCMMRVDAHISMINKRTFCVFAKCEKALASEIWTCLSVHIKLPLFCIWFGYKSNQIA